MSRKDNKIDNTGSSADNRDGYIINPKKRLGIEHWKQVSLYLAVYDAAAVTLSFFIALMLRFDFAYSLIPAIYLEPWKRFIPIYILICLPVFYRCRLYHSIWRFASFKELQRITLATVITCLIHAAGITAVFRIVNAPYGYEVTRMPASYYIIGPVIQFVLITAVRFSYRFVLLLRASRRNKNASRVMLIGAGSAGQMILRDLRRTGNIKEQVVCIIDDNRNKWGRDVDGVPVVGAKCILGTT